MTYVHVDRGKCEGFGFCEEAAPGIFQLDDDGVLTIDQSAAAAAASTVTGALRVCPVAALSATEDRPRDDA